MRVLVIGGSGFLGAQLGVSVAQHGFHGTSLSRRPAHTFDRSHRLEEPGDLSHLLDSNEWDVVINSVAIASHEECERDPELARTVNARWPEEWARLCEARGVPFVHVSTDAVFSGEQDDLYTEISLVGPTSQYGKSKREGEERVLASSPDALVVRTNFFGWSESGQVGILDFFVRHLSNGLPVTGFTDYVTSSIYAGDFADALWELIAARSSGIVHLTSSTPLSKFEFGCAVAKVFGFPVSLITPGSKDSGGLAVSRGSFLGLSNQIAEELLGREMPSTVSGLERARRERELCVKYFERRQEEVTRGENR